MRQLLKGSRASRPPHLKQTAGGTPAILLACTLLVGLITPAAQAGELGRLFFTPEQRSQLDNIYARNIPDESRSASVLTVNGIVQKHGGPRTVWINGVAQKADSSGERSPEAQSLPVPGKSQPVKVKVGQKLLLDKPPQASPTPSDK
ncbi:MAG: hypothetical protein Q7S51_02835 [Gallionellaceae bacterium]|nr:hypothetical protein [Gallionellaceae bacterium]